MPSRPDVRRGGAALTLLALFAPVLQGCTSDDDASARPVVEVFGPIVDDAGERLGEALRAASAESDVELRYIGVTSFNEQLADRLDSGDRPGVALLPQPAALTDLADRGLLHPLPDEIAEQTRDDFPSGLVDLVTIDGAPAAVWLVIDVKGLVWYRPSEFASRGLEVPSSLDELEDLAESVRGTPDRVSPWCVTLEAGASTGWVGTDWVEAFVLRRLGPERYDDWTSGRLAFDSPQIVTVFEELDGLLRQPGSVAGGSRAILTTPWELVTTGLLDDSPTCVMVQQADFLRRELPESTTVGADGDVDFFVLPAARADDEPPLVIGGTLAVPLDASAETAAAMAVLAGVDVAQELNGSPEFLSPNLRAADSVTDETSARLLELAANAPTLRFDGSDLMPVAVGTGTFWSAMRSFFAGEQVDTVVAEVQSGWPADRSNSS